MQKLFVHDDAPADLKQTVADNQTALDNVQEFKAKADANELTREDLRELSRRQLALVNPYLAGNPAAVGLVTGEINQDTLRNLAKQRLLDTKALLKQQGQPVMKVSSPEELRQLSQLSTEDLEKKMLQSVEPQKPDESQQPKKTDADDHKKKAKKKLELKFGKTKIGYSTAIEDEIFDNLVFTYRQCKAAFFNLQSKWPEIEKVERMLDNLLEPLEENGDHYVGHIFSLLLDTEEPIEKETAAYVLCSIHDGDDSLVKELVELAGDEEENLPILKNALCYGSNPAITKLAYEYLQTKDNLAALMVDILDYRGYENDLSEHLDESEPDLQAKLLKFEAKKGRRPEFSGFPKLLEAPEAAHYEDAVLAGLLRGDYKALASLREACTNPTMLTGNLPILLACSGGVVDFKHLAQCLSAGLPEVKFIRALGLFGCPGIIPGLIEFLSLHQYPITDEKELQIKDAIFDSLELITGAGLLKPDVDIKEGPEGEEYKLSAVLDYQELWAKWWVQNMQRFDPIQRVRRGVSFTLQSCLDEMANPHGNYWSRQYSYLELMIRSGINLPFEADRTVKDQLAAIGSWQKATLDNPILSLENPWCFAGKG